MTRQRKRYRLTTPTQGVHGVRRQLAEHVLKVEPERVQVITPDVGGGFGARYYCNREQLVMAWAARRVGRTVRWRADRDECFFADGQGRDHISRGELALDGEGRILALRVSATANMGAYVIHWGPGIPTDIGCEVLTGPYAIPVAHADVKCVFTNMVPIDAYRGTGRAEFIYLLERLIDKAARSLRLPPEDLRRRNFIAPGRLPYTTPTAQIYDTGDFAGAMRRAMDASDWPGAEARKRRAIESRKLFGIGMSFYVMSAAGLLDEQASMRLDGDGGVSVHIGTQSTGQGHATAYTQIVSEKLGIAAGKIRIVQGDSDTCPAGGGTGQSRSLLMGGLAIHGAANELMAKARAVAGQLMQAQASDVTFREGAFLVESAGGRMSWVEIAQALGSEDLPPNQDDLLQGSHLAEQAPMTFPYGCHICELSVDPDTGAVELLNYTTADDFGTVVNPMMCRGQVHGATVQGIGQALLEETVYAPDSGQLLTGSLVDYCLPRADDVPMFNTILLEDLPCTTNPMGVKGSGEAGTIAAPAAVINALLDALAPLGVGEIDMPATPHKVWQAIQAARAQRAS